MKSSNINVQAAFVADLAYRLANLALPKELVPTLSDVRTGISYIVRFHEIFGRGELQADGTIVWPNGVKGIVGEYFDRLEDMTTEALGYLNEISGNDLKSACLQIICERDKGEYTVIDTDTLTADSSVMRSFIADKVSFLGFRLAKVIRDSGYNTIVPAKTNFTVGNFKDLHGLEIYDAAYDEGFTPEQENGSTDESWDIHGILHREVKVKLDTVEFEKAHALKAAFNSYYELAMRDERIQDALEDTVERQVRDAKEWLERQRATSELQGRKRA